MQKPRFTMTMTISMTSSQSGVEGTATINMTSMTTLTTSNMALGDPVGREIRPKEYVAGLQKDPLYFWARP